MKRYLTADLLFKRIFLWNFFSGKNAAEEVPFYTHLLSG